MLILKDVRKLESIKLMPYVLLTFIHHRVNGTGWVLANNGPGDATVKWFSVTVDGIEQFRWRAVALSLGMGEQDLKDFEYTNPSRGTHLPENGQRDFFGEA